MPHLPRTFACLGMALLLPGAEPARALAEALPPHHRQSIEAIKKCLGKTKAAIEKGAASKTIISCDIPFTLKETELDELLTATGARADENQPADEAVKGNKKASTVKTLINVRSASCTARVRVKTELVQKAIDMKDGVMTIPAQPVTCDVITRARAKKQVRFSFTPVGKFTNGCLTSFSPKMGEFKLDCTFCRLNIVAQSLRFWINQAGTYLKPGINRALGKKCKS